MYIELEGAPVSDPADCYKPSSTIKPRYLWTNLAQQTASLAPPRIRAMEQEPSREEEEKEMIQNNIVKFIATARQHLFEQCADMQAQPSVAPESRDR